MNDCIFCKIAAGELPSFKIYEDENFLAFLDIRPLNPGHTLVIPKEHNRWVWDVPNIGEYMETAQKIANAQKKAFNIEKVESLILGEEVPHAHIWLIPRFEDDGHGGAANRDNIKEIPSEKMQEIADKIAKEL